jgi:CRP-like cAMP-binding protein
LPLLKPMKVYEGDLLYNQGDHAEEVFFIMKGRVKFYCDVSEDDLETINVPFILYVEGSCFGDSDVILNFGKDGRDATAIADEEVQLFYITKIDLTEVLNDFSHIEREMSNVAMNRKENHSMLIEQAIDKARAQKMELQKDGTSNVFASQQI